MYLESITLTDIDDIIAFVDDLGFDYEGVHEITDEQALTIDWMKVHSAVVTGTIITLDVTHLHTNWRTKYRVADHVKVLVDEE